MLIAMLRRPSSNMQPIQVQSEPEIPIPTPKLIKRKEETAPQVPNPMQIPYPTQSPFPTATPRPSPTPNAIPRHISIKHAFLDQWEKYKQNAWGHDYYHPISNTTEDIVHSQITMFEAMSTLIIMGESEEYEKANQYTGEHFKPSGTIPTRDYIPSVYGGLASILDLTEPTSITKNVFNARDLFLSFPRLDDPVEFFIYPNITFPANLSKSKIEFSPSALLSLHDQGLVQLELNSFEKRQRNPLVQTKFFKTYAMILSSQSKVDSLFSDFLDASSLYGASYEANFEDKGVTFYQFTNYTLNGFIGPLFDFIRYTEECYDNGLYRKNPSTEEMTIGMAYIPTLVLKTLRKVPNAKVNFPMAEEHAIEVMKTIMHMFENKLYAKRFWHGKVIDGTFDFPVSLFEALYTFWKETRDEEFREAMWNLFVQIKEKCWTENGFANVKVEDGKVEFLDELNPTIYSAAFKYMYITFDEIADEKLNDFVFNSHGHPILAGEFDDYLNSKVFRKNPNLDLFNY